MSTRKVNKSRYHRLPNSVIRDKRLSAPALVLLAYRTTFAGDYALNIKALLAAGICRAGMGRNVLERSIKELGDLRYLQREQAPSTGRAAFSYARETLNLPECSDGWCRTQRAWFAGAPTPKHVATVLYLRAGTGRGQGVYRAELAERFGWSPPTVRKVLDGLAAAGLLACRRAGRRGVTYEALDLAEKVKKPGHVKHENVKKPGYENSKIPGHENRKKPGHTLENPSQENPSRFSRARAREAALASAALGGALRAASHEGKTTPTPANVAAAISAALANSRRVAIPSGRGREAPAERGTSARAAPAATREEGAAADARLQAALEALHTNLRKQTGAAA